MNKENLPKDPIEADLPKNEISETAKAPKKNSNMRSRWKKSRHSQDKTPLIHTASSFGLVEQAPVAKADAPADLTSDSPAAAPEPKAIKDPIPKKVLEKAPQEAPKPPRAETSDARGPRRPSRNEHASDRSPSSRQSFAKRPLNKDYAPREAAKTSMDYEPSRSSLEKKKSLDDAILKSQETSFFGAIKKFFSRLFSGEPEAKAVQKSRPQYGRKNYYNNRKPYYSRNRNTRKDA